jgi:hypothetical protein
MNALKQSWESTPPGQRAVYAIVLVLALLALVIMLPGAFRAVVPSGPTVLEATPEAQAEIEDMRALGQMSLADLRAQVKTRQDALAKAKASKDQAQITLAQAALSRASDELFSAQASGRK